MYDLHHSQTDVKSVHLLDGGFPVLDFNGALAVGQQDDLPCPCLLTTEELVLCLNSDNESIDSYRRQLD